MYVTRFFEISPYAPTTKDVAIACLIPEKLKVSIQMQEYTRSDNDGFLQNFKQKKYNGK